MQKSKVVASRRSIEGLSLIELISSLALVAGLSTATLQGYTTLQRSTEALVTMQRLQRTLNVGRSRAITSSKPQILCPSIDGLHCGGEWQGGILVRSAGPQNDSQQHESSSQDTVDASARWWQEMNGTHGSVTWRAFGSSKQLRLEYAGVVIAQNGSFVYCPRDTEHGLAARLVVNRTARGRVELNLNPSDYCDSR